MLEQIPRPLLVVGVLLIGIGLFFVIQEPQSVCNAQVEVFKESQAGAIFPRKLKNAERQPVFARTLENCKRYNSSGACFELFSLMRKLVRDLNAAPQECLAPFGEIAEVKTALYQGQQLIAQIAWGDRPPDVGVSKFSWLEAPDLSLYCQLKRTFLKTYGEEAWEKFRMDTQKTLPGEAPVLEEGNCLNCETMKKASEVLSPEEIWSKSIFSLRCDQYL